MKKIIIANWKENPQTILEAKEVFIAIRNHARLLKRVKTVVCPPYIYASELIKLCSKKTDPSIGVQDIFWNNDGAWTGEIGSLMIKNLGATVALVGHSERRLLGETNEDTSLKVEIVVKAGLFAVLCVGEAVRDSHGNYLAFVKEQIVKGLVKVSPKLLKNIVVAYEPVWAIGKKDSEAMNSQDVREMSIYIKKIIADLYGQEEALKIPILYGGSISSKNTPALFEEGQVAGLLIGRSSLDSNEFKKILTIAEASKI